MKVLCGICKGAIRGRKQYGAKTQKSTARKFPQLCMSCLRQVVIESVRVQEGFKSMEEVALHYRFYSQRMAK